MFEELFRQARVSVQDRIYRFKKRVTSYAVAGVLMAAALFFALLTAYLALLYLMSPVLAAGLLFLLLLAGGIAALYAGRAPAGPDSYRRLQRRADETVAKENGALRSPGLPLILTAFAAGLALSRGRFLNGSRPHPPPEA
jgi:Kef-type K+ transport system membrane component KefB